MPSARVIQRRRVLTEVLEAARREFGPRNAQNTDRYREFLRKNAENYRVDPEGEPEQFLPYANTWGFARWNKDPREYQVEIDRVRAGLLEPGDILTELLVPRETAEKPPVPEREPGITYDKPEDEPVEATGIEPTLPVEPITRDGLRKRIENEDSPVSIGIDLPISPSLYGEAGGHWSAPKNRAPTFGTARDAMRLVNAPWAANSDFNGVADCDGTGVNIVIVDEGLNAQYLSSIHPGFNFQGGFVSTAPSLPLPGLFSDPFNRAPSWHGNMIARNILRIAPNAKIYDAPLLPPRVVDIPTFTSTVQLLYQGILFHAITGPFRKEPWIIVNAWAVADSISQYGFGVPERFLYTEGDLHPTNLFLQFFGRHFDAVFAAGNSGEFAPVKGSGIYERGPGRSIKGSNALSNVLTVAACDVTGRWIGTSSQGDGPVRLKYAQRNRRKPDLSAPSWFCENADAGTFNTGSSAACAVAAGIMASLRTSANRTDTPAAFRNVLRAKNAGSVAADARLRAGKTVLTI